MKRAAIYVRISDDREGEGLGVKRQYQDCVELCEKRDLIVVDTYEDNDVSAYSGKPRPEFRRLLADVEAGQVDVIVSWADDRLIRSPRELEDFIDLVEATKVPVVTVTSGDYDLTSPEGRAHARIVGAIARQESERKSVRAKRKARQLAEDGKVGGGGTRPFGFADDRIAIVEEEARVIRAGAAALAAGRSLKAVTRDFNNSSRTPTNKEWKVTTVRNVLSSARIAGLRQHQGEVVGEAEWDAIVDRATWEQVQRRIRDRATSLGRSRTYLLTGGILHCGNCGTPMLAQSKGQGRRNYRCRGPQQDPGYTGCGRVQGLAEPIEHEVRDVVLAALGGDALGHALNEHDGDDDRRRDLVERVDHDQRALEELEVAHYTEGVLSKAGYLRARRTLTDRIAENREQLGAATGRRFVASLPRDEDELRAAWETADLEWRQELLRSVLEAVHLGPALRGRNYFDPDRLSYVWKA